MVVDQIFFFDLRIMWEYYVVGQIKKLNISTYIFTKLL